MSLEAIFDEKIKLGRAQFIPLLFLSLIELNDGAQLVLSILHISTQVPFSIPSSKPNGVSSTVKSNL